MTNSRHSFSATVFDEKYVYVYGGVVGQLDNSHSPILAAVVVEKYDFHNDKWESIKIAGIPKLTAFGHAFDNITQKLYIIGGSDGHLLTN